MKKKIALIDGYGFLFRAYFSMPPLSRDDGTPVGAVYGFTNMLIRLLANLNASHICMIFDSGSKTFRNEIYSDYKANRPPCPEDLIPQFPLIREASESFDIAVLEKVGYEADDLIATIAKDAAKKGFEVTIISSDKDLMQLINDDISMFDPMKNKIITAKEVEEKFMVPPHQVLDVLSLMGDASDNVPGVMGIGPKISAELISKYQTLENLLENLDEIKQNKRRESLINGKELAILSKELITLCDSVPIDLNMEQFTVKPINPKKLVAFLKEQGFRALEQRIIKEFDLNLPAEYQNNTKNGKKNQNLANFSDIKNIIINNKEDLANKIHNLSKLTAIIIDFDYDMGANTLKNIIFSPINNNKHQESYKIIIKNNDIVKNQPVNDLFAQESDKNTEEEGILLQDFIDLSKDILTDSAILKIGYKIKEIYKFFAKNDIILSQIADISVMSYILNSASNKSNIRNLIDINLDENTQENDFGAAFDDLEKNKIPKLFNEEDKKEQFYFFKNYAIFQLYNILKQNIFDSKLNFVYQQFEIALIPIIAKMEMAGIAVDALKLKELSAEFDLKIKKLTNQIYDLAGEEFNIGSPKQLSYILFEKLSLPAGKKSKTGAYSTNSDILEDLTISGHEIAQNILDWRHISKLKSTYSDALQNNINPKTNRIHSNFSNTSTSTGRLSSNNPNLQNIPIRTNEGKKIRQAFIAKKDHQFILADYSQVELRVLAHMADIKSLKNAFESGKDIHNITASQIFGISEDKIDSDMRRKAKAINFGIIYGISAFGLARQLKIDRKDASNYIKNYFIAYPGIKEFMNKYQDLAENQGYVETITGRKCFISGIDSKNPIIKGLAQRLAINAPIQGSAADIIKKAMIDLDKKLTQNNLKTKLILQIHDELILEAPQNELDQAKKLLKESMEQSFQLDVPLKVDLDVRNYW